VDRAAYDEFLRGIVRFPYTTPATFDEVVGYFERAAQLDERFAGAHAWIAFAWMNAVYAGARPLGQARARALPAIRRALAEGPELGSVRAVHATALFALERDWSAAEAAWAEAETLRGGDTYAYAAHVLFLAGMGRFEEALARAREGVGINPLGAPEQYLVGWVHFRARRYDEAAKQLGWTRAQWPDYPWTAGSLAASQLFGGRPAAAIETCRDALTTPNIPTCLAYIVATLGRAGAVAEARSAMEQLEDIDRTSYLDPYPLAVAYAGVGETEMALDTLERVVEEGSIQSWSVAIEVFFDPLRRQRRFRRVLAALQLPSDVP
jgi:tetratricopeptide (TPR) repeat protein